MYKYEQPGFTGYKRSKPIKGDRKPCKDGCGRLGGWQKSLLCKKCFRRNRREKYWAKRDAKCSSLAEYRDQNGIIPSRIPVNPRKQTKLLPRDVVMPVVLFGDMSNDVFGNTCAGKDWTKGYIQVKGASNYYVTTKEGYTLNRQWFRFQLVYRPAKKNHSKLGLAPPVVRPKGQVTFKEIL